MCGDDVIKTKKVHSEVPEILSIKMATPVKKEDSEHTLLHEIDTDMNRQIKL